MPGVFEYAEVLQKFLSPNYTKEQMWTCFVHVHKVTDA
jgi:hypothetical protein